MLLLGGALGMCVWGMLAADPEVRRVGWWGVEALAPCSDAVIRSRTAWCSSALCPAAAVIRHHRVSGCRTYLLMHTVSHYVLICPISRGVI